MRTITHTSPGPVHFSLAVDVAEVDVVAEQRDTATVTLAPVDPSDQDAARLIESATHTSDGKDFTVRVPRPAGGNGGSTTVVRSGRGVHVTSQVVTGNVTGVVMVGGNVYGSTIVNGQVISGAGTVVIGGSGLRVTVRIPLGSSVTLTGQSPNLTAEGRLNRVEAETVSGDLDVASAITVQARSTSGDVHIGACPAVSARTVSGDVVVRELNGTAAVKTVSGDVQVHAVADSIVTARSVSGDVDLTAPKGVDIDADTSTVSGRVRNRRR
jgi:hypothetical protein